jgi:hypothetical protein
MSDTSIVACLSRVLGFRTASMYDINQDPVTVWKKLKQGQLTLVQWTLSPDERVRASLRALLGEEDDQSRATALGPVVVCSCNCIGQLGLHGILGDESKPPYLEAHDARWSPLRLLPAEASRRIGFRIVSDDSFLVNQRNVLAEVLEAVRSGKGRPHQEMMSTIEGAAMFQTLLLLLGSELGKIIDEEGKTFLSLLGEVADLNKADDPGHSPFQKLPDDRSRYGSEYNSRNWLR